MPAHLIRLSSTVTPVADPFDLEQGMCTPGFHKYKLRKLRKLPAAPLCMQAEVAAVISKCVACRDFLEEVSRPDRSNLGHVPVSPCLRSLRPVLVTLRRLTTEVQPHHRAALTMQITSIATSLLHCDGPSDSCSTQ